MQREIAAVHGIEAALVDFEPAQRAIGDARVDRLVAGDGGEIAHPAQQAHPATRGVPRARRAISPAPLGGQLEGRECAAARPTIALSSAGS